MIWSAPLKQVQTSGLALLRFLFIGLWETYVDTRYYLSPQEEYNFDKPKTCYDLH